MRILFCLLIFSFHANAKVSQCEMSFANEYSARAEAPSFHRAMLSLKNILIEKGFKIISAFDKKNELRVTEFEMDIHYFDYEEKDKLVSLWVSDKNGIILENLQHYTDIKSTVRELFLSLPSCEIVRKISRRGGITR